jgi:hypothetical protein
MSIHEPMTLATDLVLGGVAVGLALPLLGPSTRGHRSRRLWGWALALTGLAAWTGGIWHGFGPEMAPSLATVLWKTTVFSIGGAAAAMLAGAVLASLRPPASTLMLGVVALKLALYLAWMSRHDDFRYVIYDYAPAMGLALCLQVIAAARGNGRGAGFIVAGILVSFAAAAIQRTEATYSAYFNANDLYHLVQIGALVLLYFGARRLEDA